MHRSTRSPPPSASRVTRCGRAASSLSASPVPSSAASAVRVHTRCMCISRTPHTRLPHAARRGTLHAPGGPLADSVGRKGSFAYTATACAVGAALCASARSLPALLLGRLICGVGIGAALCGVSLFIPEVAPPSQRGFLSSLNQVPRLPACPSTCLPAGLCVTLRLSSSLSAAALHVRRDPALHRRRPPPRPRRPRLLAQDVRRRGPPVHRAAGRPARGARVATLARPGGAHGVEPEAKPEAEHPHPGPSPSPKPTSQRRGARPRPRRRRHACGGRARACRQWRRAIRRAAAGRSW